MTTLMWALVLLAEIPPAPVPRPDWQVIHSDGGLTVYLDPGSARRSGDVIRIDIHSIAMEPGPGGMTSTSMLTEFDCRLRTVSMVEAHAYGQGGVHLEGGAPPPGERRARPWEGSDEEEVAQRACAIQAPAR